MDILNQDFEEKLPLVLEAIKDCDFLAIDAEFSGLHKSSGQYRFNTVQQTYTNYVGSASSFLIVQIGICAFHWSSTAKRYFAKPFNFYVFPRGSRGRSLNRNFLVQSTAFDFLAGVGFDFNKWVYSGIPYLTFQEEDQFKKESIEKLENNMATIPIDPKDMDFVKNFRDKIDEWLLLPKNRTHNGVDIEASNSYRKRLIHQEVRNNYPDLKTIGKQYSVNVSRTSDKQREERRIAMQQKFDEEIDIAVGFRKVIDAISASKKTIVGHNCFLDLLHLYYQFMAPLPSKVEDFKKVVHKYFPSVIDTKYLATSCPALSQIQSTSLENLYFETRLPPFTDPKIESHWDYSKYQDSKAHEAAYDAYITGYVFLRLSEYLNITATSTNISLETTQLSEVDDEDSDNDQTTGENEEPLWDRPPKEQQPDIDITNISWDKSFDNKFFGGMSWSEDTSNPVQTDQEDVKHDDNNSGAKKTIANEVKINTITGMTVKQQVEHAIVQEEKDKAALSSEDKQTLEEKEYKETPQSSDDTPDTNVVNCYKEGGLLEQYINKLHIMKSVSDYMSLTSPEVILDHSTVFRIFSKDAPISNYQTALHEIGEYDLEIVDPYCAFVMFRNIDIDQATVVATLKTKYTAINIDVETMYDYLANQGISFPKER